MSDNVIYSATATAWGGRQGQVTSSDNHLDLQLSTPKEMGGDGAEGTNPEQMFAGGWAACFHSALKQIARSKKVDVSESAVSVTVSLVGSVAERSLGLAARIEAELPGVDPSTGNELLEATHQLCPYSVATRGNVPSEVVLIGDE